MNKLLLPLFCFGVLPIANAITTSCVGYVKSDIPVDLSHIQVKLFTDRGNLKFETESNPSDGFYTIPIYNAGKYQIRAIAPDGWIFEKNFVNVEIGDEGVPNVCDSDVNFKLYAFSISGVVRSGNAPGPNGFRLALYEAKSTAAIASATTTESGKYEFIVKPGDYVISTEDRSAQCIDRGKVQVSVRNGPVLVSPDIQISGYNLKVFVRDERGAALANAIVTLSSKTKLLFENIPVSSQKPQGKPSAANAAATGWEYSLRSDADGAVQFYCLPPANYALTAGWRIGNVNMNFPSKNDVKIDFKAAEVVLNAVSFDVSGHVGQASASISNAEILLNGELKTVSDKSGRYTLSGMRVGTYKVTARKEHYKFTEIVVSLAPRSDVIIPNIKIESIAICGIVDFDTGKNTGRDREMRVSLSIKSLDKDKKPEIINIDSHFNKFCKSLALGSYVIEPLKSGAYSFSPKSVRVDVVDTPVFDIHFTQFKATIAGSVKCFETCKNVIIQLWQDEELIAEQSTTADFKFIDVIPAAYTVKIRDDYNFWWEKSKHSLQIVDKNVENLVFRQTGYKAVIRASHPCELKYAPISVKNFEQTVQLNNGANTIFFPKSGKYSVNAMSCHKFKLSMERAANTRVDYIIVPSAERWILAAEETQISAAILVAKPTGSDAKFQLIVKNQKANSAEIKVDVTNVNAEKTNHSFVFYIKQIDLGQEFNIIPRSDKYIFRPASIAFTFNGDCQSNVAVFQSEIGKVISGVVTPPVEGVQVSITNKNDLSNVQKTLTNAEGKYKMGGIWSVNEWRVELAMEGYEFQPIAGRPFDFRSVKLSYLRVDFLDIETLKPLADVLVSISGPNNYRSSSVVDASGSLVIIGLLSGEYFVRPILQEYKFNATSIGFQIREGDSEKITLYAKKVAYSAFGKITSISKQPIKNVATVEAVSEQCKNHQEEYTTKMDDSEFRIRGLLPDCLYRITIKDEAGRRLKSYPPFIDLMVERKDVHNLNFIILPVENKMTIFGKIDFSALESRQKQSNAAKKARAISSTSAGDYRVVLRQPNNAILKEIVVSNSSSTFLITNLDINRVNYSIAIEKAEARRHGIQPMAVNFIADGPFKYIKFVPKLERVVVDVEVSRTNCLGLALIVLITLWFLNPSKAKMTAEKLLNYGNVLFHNAQNAVGELAQSNNNEENANRKRKPKK